MSKAIRRVVTPGYFDALGMRLRAGRALNDADTANAPRAVVVNRTFVAKYLDNMPIERAIGLSLGTGAVRVRPPSKVEAFIVGVVDDIKQDRPDEPPQAEMFVVVRASGAASTRRAGIRRRAHRSTIRLATSRRCAPRCARRIRHSRSMR